MAQDLCTVTDLLYKLTLRRSASIEFLGAGFAAVDPAVSLAARSFVKGLLVSRRLSSAFLLGTGRRVASAT